MTFDGAKFGADIVAQVKAYVERTTAPLVVALAAAQAESVALTAKLVALEARLVDPTAMRKAIEDSVLEAIAKLADAIPHPRDGRDADPELVRALVDQVVADRVAKIPAPAAGKDADPQLMRQMIDQAVAAAVSQIPAPRDGRDVDPELVRSLVDTTVAAAIERIPTPAAPAPAVGLADVLVDQDGDLHVLLTDGTRKAAGRVRGRDADLADVTRLVREEVAKVPPPTLEGLTLRAVDGGRQLVLEIPRAGHEPVTAAIQTETVIDRGVWQPGVKQAGDGVTWKGSYWVAQRETAKKPDDADSGFRLMVRKGRDGRDATPRLVGAD
jgi:hypothetical protein